MSQRPKVVVVMPAYNAAKTLHMTYADLPHDVVDLVILVDDGSKDETARIARELGLELFVHDKNYGYGANQKTCYREALTILQQAAHPGRKTYPAEARAKAPRAPRREAEHQQLALASEHAIHFAHDGVRVGGELKRMRQQHRVHRIAVDRQLRRAADHVGTVAEFERGHDRLAACATAAEQLPTAAPGTYLQQLPAEDVFERFAQELGFRGQQARAERAGPPGAEGCVTIQRCTKGNGLVVLRSHGLAIV